MVERAASAFGFALKADETFGVAGERIGQDFDGYFAIELGVLGAAHLTHAAFADGAGDFVGAEAGSDG